MPTLIFVVALPDQAAILGVGIPHLTAILPTTFPAENFHAERMGAARPVAVGPAPFPLILYKVEYLRRNDSWMAIFYIILRNLALVGFYLFAGKIHREFFPQAGVALAVEGMDIFFFKTVPVLPGI